ncbi:MAG TPA: phospholipid carrier-dependent glycosyltransferase, partial [Actinomycetota bacterium]
MGRAAAVEEPIGREGGGEAPRSLRMRLRERRQRGIAAGMAGALLAFLALTSVQALGVAPYLPPDELYHVGYAVVVGDGHLPTLTTPVPIGEIPLPPRDGRPRRVYTANHPPLFYLPESIVLRIGPPAVALLAARLLSACFGAAGVLLVAWLALVVVPDRPRVAVAAAWLVALLPAVPHYSAFVYNDGLGFLASTAALVAGAITLRRGPTWWRLLGLSAAAAAAAQTRAPGLALIAVAGTVTAVAVWLHVRRPAARRLLLAAGTGALVGGASLA